MCGRKAGRLYWLLLLSLPVISLVWLVYLDMRQDHLNHALIAAIKRQDAPAALANLNAGADPNSREENSKPLSLMQALGRLLTRLWGHSKSSSPQQGQTALMLALQGDQEQASFREAGHLTSLISMMVAKGANLRVSDRFGNTALMIAAFCEPTSTVKAMLDKGAEVNAKSLEGNTALLGAADSQHAVTSIQLLLARGADLNARDVYGDNALTLAAMCGYNDAVKLLLDRGIDVNSRTQNRISPGWTALMLAAAEGYTDTVQALLARGAEINAKGSDGFTALMGAAKSEDPKTLKVLLAHGAEFNVKDQNGKTPLKYAKEGFNSPFKSDVIYLLKQAGAKE